MTDLTDRIAQTLLAHPDKWDGTCCGGQDFASMQQWADHLAAVLVAELGLRDEWGALDAKYGGALYDSRNDLRVLKGERVMHRYITEWTSDD